MLPSKDTEVKIIPPKTRLLYTDFRLISRAHYFKIFSALAKIDSKSVSVRFLDFNSEFYCSNPNVASTLFIQELLRLCTLHPESIIIDHFEICDKAIAFVTTPYLPLEHVVKEMENPQSLDIEKLIKDVLIDLNFLVYDMRLAGQNSTIHIGFDNIYQISGTESYIVGDWAKGFEGRNVVIDTSELNSTMTDKPSNGDREIETFAGKLLMLLGVKDDELQDLLGMKNLKMYMGGLDTILNGIDLTKNVKKMLRSMLARESSLKMKLAEFSKRKLARAEILETKGNDSSSFRIKEIPKQLATVCRFGGFYRVTFFQAIFGSSNGKWTDAIAFKVSQNTSLMV